MKLFLKIFFACIALLILVSVIVGAAWMAFPRPSKETAPEDVFSLSATPKQKQQLFLQKNVESVLYSVLGKDHVKVTVYVNYEDAAVETKTIRLDPRQIKEQSNKRYEESLPPSGEEIKNTTSPASGAPKLPGLPSVEGKKELPALPGFPKIQADKREKTAVVKPGTKTASTDKNSSRRFEESTTKVYYNQTEEIISKRDERIRNVFINLVVDKNQLTARNLTIEDIRTLVEGTVGFDPKRGDALYSLVYPFPEKGSAVALSSLMASPIFNNPLWLGLGVIVLLLCGGLVYFLTRRRKRSVTSDAIPSGDAIQPSTESHPSSEEQQSALDAEPPASASSPFSFINEWNPNRVIAYFQKETDQVRTLLFKYLNQDQSARLLENISPDFAYKLIAPIEAPNPILLSNFASALKEQSQRAVSEKQETKMEHLRKIARIMELMASTRRAETLTAIEKEDPALADSLRQLIFNFEDFVKLDDHALQTILFEVADYRSIAIAVQYCSPKLKMKILRCLTERTQTIVDTELTSVSGKVSETESEDAQRGIIDIARELEERDLVTLPRG